MISNTRKPRGDWSFEDNHVTGIYATRKSDSNDALLLPYDLADEERDFILWAYEVGYWHGQCYGEGSTKQAMRKALGIEP